MNSRIRRRLTPALLALSLIAASGCTAGKEKKSAGQAAAGQKTEQQAAAQQGYAGPGARPDGASRLMAQSSPSGMQALGTDNAVIPMLSANNTMYVPLRDLANVLQFNTEWDASSQTFKMGDNDFPYAVTMNSLQAMKDGDPATLSSVPKMQGGAPYLPVSAVADLLREEMSYEVKGDRLIVHPSNVNVANFDSADSGAEDGLQFADDPNDPFKGPIPENAQASGSAQAEQSVTVWNGQAGGEEAVPAAAKNIDINGLIRFGMRYLGVPYLFGASPYPQSGRFDCSSFTRYVYGKYGISLPRTARQQARLGSTVSRKSLRKGDLVFFYIPGRFKSNRTVGHVGIYIGGMQMLNADNRPKNGVQITNIDKPFWRQTFLYAKRVAY